MNAANYLGGVQMFGNYGGGRWYEADVPAGTVLICVTNNLTYCPTPYVSVDCPSKAMLGISSVNFDEVVNGEGTSETLSLSDIGFAAQNWYINTLSNKPASSANCVITNPIYLRIGDTVSCETGGTGLVLFFSLNNGLVITSATEVKAAIKAANDSNNNTTYEATIEEDGWYGFSGRINRNDGTNLVVSVTRHYLKNSLDERFAGKPNRNEIVGDFGLIALSVGADSVKDAVPSAPWFDAVATRYGVRVQGATDVALTNIDVLGYLDEIPVCVGYEIDGKGG